MKTKHLSGIYEIICKPTQKRYVGSAVNLERRKKQHFTNLQKSNHPNTYLQNSYTKYGKDNFEFKILCYYEPTELIFQEQRFLDYYKKDSLFNICKTAGSTLGLRHTDETKKKISLGNKGNKHTDEAKIKISKVHKGKIISEKTKKKMRKVWENQGDNAWRTEDFTDLFEY
ncbi:MAG: GIY-YIG nuclease family protein [Candidatus Scalindua sp.]|jgi:group I intron endonuclease|nr:GIY-YIG nuclease family protein [Candidatus Scalindua sp.]